MNREIKFRAWDKKTKEMFYDVNVLASSKSQSAWISDIGVGEYVNPKAENYEVMQFTGLKDKNEKEIYEGDIVDTGNPVYKFEVVFAEGCFGVLDRTSKLNPFWQHTSVEVIGNIYENPELTQSNETKEN